MLDLLQRKWAGFNKRIDEFATATKFYVYNHFVSKTPGYWIRRAYLNRILKMNISPFASMHMGCFVTGHNIRIGKNSIINRCCYLDGRGELSIGSNVSISPHVFLITASHDVGGDFRAYMSQIEIGDRVWIGTRATILPGVTLGEGTIVGSGSIVTKSAEPFSIVAGNPAKKIGERSRDIDYQLRYFPWYDTDIGI